MNNTGSNKLELYMFPLLILMTVFRETSHGRYDTGGHPDDLLFFFKQSLTFRRRNYFFNFSTPCI